MSDTCGLFLSFRSGCPAMSLPAVCSAFTSFAHGFFHSFENGPLRLAVSMIGGFPRRYCRAIASILRRFAV